MTTNARGQHDPTSVKYNGKVIANFDHHELRVDKTIVPYSDIEAVAYQLRTFTYLIMFIPIFNNISFVFTVRKNDGKIHRITRKSYGLMGFEPFRKNDIEQTYKQLVERSATSFVPIVYRHLVELIVDGYPVMFGAFSIGKDSVRVKKAFGRHKEMDSYGKCRVANGYVYVYDGDEKLFDSISLSTDNAPLIPYLLEKFYG